MLSSILSFSPINNFLRTYLTSDQKKIVKDFEKADFTRIHKYLVDLKEDKANRTAEQKKVHNLSFSSIIIC